MHLRCRGAQVGQWCVLFHVAKATLATGDYTGPAAISGLAFTRTEQQLVTAGTIRDDISGPNFMYGMKNNSGEMEWTDTVNGVKGYHAGTYTVYWYIKGGVNYKDVGSETAPAGSVEVTVAPKSITPTVALENSVFTYDGTEKKPTVTGTTGDETLVEDTDYTVSYENNTDAGENTAFVTITARADRNYTWTPATTTFSIQKADITPSVTMSGYTYGAAPSTPSVAGNAGNGTVAYYYSQTNSTEGGTLWDTTEHPTLDAGTYYLYAEVAETANYNSAKTTAVEFTVRPASVGALLTDPESAGSRTYNGGAQTLVTAGTLDNRCGAHTFYYRLVRLDGDAETTVVDWTDDAASIKAADVGSYRIDWYCHIDSDNYDDCGSKEKPNCVRTHILPRSVAGATIALGDALTYTGAEQTQTLAAVTLSLGDYTLTVTGIGNYTGTQDVDWAIGKADAPELDKVETSRRYNKTGDQTVSVKERMPDDAQVTGYALGDLPQGVTAASVDGDGTLHFAINGLAAGDAGKTFTVPVVIRSRNYEDATVNVVVTITKYTPLNDPINGHAVKTGDEATPVVYLAVAVLALGVIVTLVVARKKKA